MTEDVERLNEKCKNTVETIDRVAKHFGEDMKKFVVEECFTLLANFFERIEIVAKVSILLRIILLLYRLFVANSKAVSVYLSSLLSCSF